MKPATGLWIYTVVDISSLYFQVYLYVDGELRQTKMISDDWPIHRSHYPTSLTVGACFDGKIVVLGMILTCCCTIYMYIALKSWPVAKFIAAKQTKIA